MVIGDCSAGSCKEGDTITLVGLVFLERAKAKFEAYWDKEVFDLHHTTLHPGVWTLYDSQYGGVQDGRFQLLEQPSSRAHVCGPCSPDAFRSMVELCCGLGGIAIGAA